MARSKYEKGIEELIDSINTKTGLNYRTDYSVYHGGWNLYYLNEHGGHITGKYGFDYRLSSKEMVQRLLGILSAL